MSTNRLKGVRIYDSGPGGCADRYTVCYPAYRCGPDYEPYYAYPYLGMSAAPFHPQGVGQHGESVGKPIDRPSYKHLGRRIMFNQLPEDCQRALLQDLQED